MSRLAALLLGLLLLAPAVAQAQVLAYPSGVAGLTVNNCATANRLLYLSSTGVTNCSTLSYDGTNVTLASGQMLKPDGSTTAPADSWTNATGAGWWRSGAGSYVFNNAASSPILRLVASDRLAISSDMQVVWASTTDATATPDLLLGRAAAANLRLGAAAANPPVAQTLSTQPASGTDVAGANFTIDVSPGTGTGAGGSFIVRTAAASASLATALTIDSTKLATFAGALTTASNIRSGNYLIAAATGWLQIDGRGGFSSPGDGILMAQNNAATELTRFVLGTNNTSGVSLVKSGTALQVALGDGTLGGSIMGIPVAAQTIADTNTITADACGTIKRITSAGAVTTNTTNTFTAPAAANAGCTMYVVNVGANNITLDTNANFVSPGAADVVLGPNDAIIVGSTGASGAWYALSALVAN